MNEIKLNLTKEQTKHIKTLLWLYDEIGNRRTGRTTLIAYALIFSVLKDKKTRRIIDHFSSQQADNLLKPIICEIIEHNKLPLKVIHSTLELSFIK